MQVPVGLNFKVDMDYCADPIWISTDGIHWVNDDLSQYKDVMSSELYDLMRIWQDQWERDLWRKDTDQIDAGIEFIENSNVFSVYLAERLKQEWPKCNIFAGFFHDNHKSYKVIKIENT